LFIETIGFAKIGIEFGCGRKDVGQMTPPYPFPSGEGIPLLLQEKGSGDEVQEKVRGGGKKERADQWPALSG